MTNSIPTAPVVQVPIVVIQFRHPGTDTFVVEGNGTFAAKEVLKRLGYRWDGQKRQWWKAADEFSEPRVELQEAAERLAVHLRGTVHVQMSPHSGNAICDFLDTVIHNGVEWERAIKFIG